MLKEQYRLAWLAWLILSLTGFRQLWHNHEASAAAPRGLIGSVSDANLMFEFLLSGLVIDADNNVAMRDQELASMRQGRAFLTFINDNVPKTVSTMEDLLVSLADQEEPLSQSRFETLILGVIYSAYQLHRQKEEDQQQAWAHVLGRLANITLIELRRYCKIPGDKCKVGCSWCQMDNTKKRCALQDSSVWVQILINASVGLALVVIVVVIITIDKIIYRKRSPFSRFSAPDTDEDKEK